MDGCFIHTFTHIQIPQEHKEEPNLTFLEFINLWLDCNERKNIWNGCEKEERARIIKYIKKKNWTIKCETTYGPMVYYCFNISVHFLAVYYYGAIISNSIFALALFVCTQIKLKETKKKWRKI